MSPTGDKLTLVDGVSSLEVLTLTSILVELSSDELLLSSIGSVFGAIILVFWGSVFGAFWASILGAFRGSVLERFGHPFWDSFNAIHEHKS